ncbi:MAG: ankyrin repeat domain-containing protein [Vicinamibacterales bacterium]
MRAKLMWGPAELLIVMACLVGQAAAAGDPALVRATAAGDAAQVRTLLQQRVNVNEPSADGTTALHWAARRDAADLVSLLVRAGANVRAANRYGVTPLLLACETAGMATVEALLKGGADPNDALPEGQTALMAAARSGKTDLVKLLVANGANVDARESWHAQTALMWAAAEDHPDVVKALVEMGADIKARTPGGFTALLFAARAGSLESVKTLLALGADINDALMPEPKPGVQARATQASAPTTGVRAGVSPTNGAAVAGGLTPSNDGTGTSALIFAVTNKRWSLARYLVEQGADPNDARSGWTVLHELAYLRRPNTGKGLPPSEEVEHVDTLELAKVFIEHGANVNARQTKERRDGARNDLNRIGATPLLLAAKHADVPYMRFLAEHGADPSIRTEQDTTVLAAAAGVGIFNVGESAGTNEEAFEAVKLAWELGSRDVNTPDWNGWMPIHGAAKRGANEIVQFLADHDSDLQSATYTEGWTPVRIADGIFVGATIKRADETAALLRALLQARGLPVPPKNVNDVADAGNR